MRFSIKGKILFFNEIKVKEFNFPIYSLVEFKNITIVLLDKDAIDKSKIFRNVNVFGINSKGKTLWQVEKREHIYEDSPYIELTKKGDKVWLHNWDGTIYVTDPLTGKSNENFWTK